jgi:hypothetical protein
MTFAQDDFPHRSRPDEPGDPADPAARPDATASWPAEREEERTEEERVRERAGEPAPARPLRGFKGWRRGRPFWGGLLVLLGGGEILLSEQASISVVLKAGADSLAGYLLPVVMVVCGLLILFNPMHRIFYSVIAVLCSLATWVTSNLGGFFIGMLFGLIGSSLAFGWLPDQEPRRWRRSRKTAPSEEPEENRTPAEAG